MADPLIGPRLKLSTAHKKIGDFEALLISFGSNVKADAVTSHKDPNTGETVFRFLVTKPMAADPSWGIAVSEIAHLLRSCLDNLAWQLALLNTPSPFRNTEYPIYLNRRTKVGSGYIPSAIGKKANGRTIGKSRSIRPKHRAIMERTQPYRRRADRVRDPLWMRHEMNNADKHRDIHFTNVCSLTSDIYFGLRDVSAGKEKMTTGVIARGLTIATGIVFENGAEFLRVRSIAPEVTVHPDYSIDICFDGRCPASFAKLPVVKTLAKIEARVKEILDIFEAEF